MALNIQRARDHGLGDYNTAREEYGLPRITNWTHINPALAAEKPEVRQKELWICFRYFSIQQEQRIPNQILKNSFRITMNRFTCTKSLIAISKSLVRMWTRLQYYLCNFYWLQDTPRQSLLRMTGIIAPLIYDSGI